MRVDTTAFDILQPVGASPVLILPDPSRIFLDRSRRFAYLAKNHSLSDWLSFLGRLTEIQHELLQNIPPPPLPDKAELALARKHRLPPVSASSWPRDPSWRESLTVLARELAPCAPVPGRETLQQIQALDSATLDGLADQVLRGEWDGYGAKFLPFVASALQLHWTALAAGLDRAKIALLDDRNACPCCGYAPVAGIVRTDGEVPKLRYLHCALCNTEWHLVRVTCAACLDGNRIAYYHLEDSDESTRAETCDACRSYLKIVYREKDPHADPVADDLATLALDLLVQEAGYFRASPSLLLIPGID